MFCREQAVRLHRERERIEAAGARLAFVGNGGVAAARAFRDDYALDVPVFVDPKRTSYQALGFRRGGVATTLRPEVLRSGARALKAGFRQGRVQGDPWQLGGVLVVRPDGSLAFRHDSALAGDHPAVDAVLAAVGAAPRGDQPTGSPG